MHLMHIVNTLGPVFFIIALGAALRNSDLLTGEFTKRLNWLSFWVGIPALLFYKMGLLHTITASRGK